MGVFLWSNYWCTPGDSFTDKPSGNIVVDSVATGTITTSSDLDVGGKLLYQTKSWIPYTPSLALVLLNGYGTGLAIASNTVTGRYRRLSSEFVLFEIRGDIVFSTGSGQALLQVGIPSLPPVSSFTVNGSFMGTSFISSTPFSVSLTGYGAASATSVILSPQGIADQTSSVPAAYGINSYANAARTITITASGVYEVL
jgi:hypothetical protein